jgi:transposase
LILTSKAKGHNYVSLFKYFDKSKVIHVCEGKDASTLDSFKTDLELHKGSSKNIDNVCRDMSPAFISMIEDKFPNASITFNKLP